MGLHPLAVLLRCSAKAEALPQSCCGCALLLGWHCTVPSQDAQSTANCLQLQSTKTIVHPPRDPIKIPVKAAVTQTTGSAVELSQGSCSTIGNPKPPPTLTWSLCAAHEALQSGSVGAKRGQPYSHACGAGSGAVGCGQPLGREIRRAVWAGHSRGAPGARMWLSASSDCHEKG